jgi:hypothetical protein
MNLRCKWLQNCGEQKDIHYDFDVFFQHDYNKAIRTTLRRIGKIFVWKKEGISLASGGI